MQSGRALPKREASSSSVSLLRQRRRQESASSQKSQRDRLVATKRFRVIEDSGVDDADGDEQGDEQDEEHGEGSAGRRKRQQLGHLRQRLHSGAADERISALRQLHRVIAADVSETTERFLLETDLVALLTTFLLSNEPDLLLGALWCLSNVAAYREEVCRKTLDAVPCLISLLDSANPMVQEQAAFVLGNIAGDEASARDLLIRQEIVPPLLRLASVPNPIPAVFFVISNLLRGPSANDALFLDAGLLAILTRLLPPLETMSMELALEVGWTLSFLTAKSEAIGQSLMQHGLAGFLVHWIAHAQSHNCAAISLIRTMGNIVCGQDDALTVALLQQAGFGSVFASCLAPSATRATVKESLWVFSNVTACRSPVVDAFLAANMPLVGLVLDMLAHEAYDLRSEIAFAVVNLVQRSPSLFFPLVLDGGGLEAFVELLTSSDPAVAAVCLQFLELLLRFDRKATARIEAAGGIDALERLQYGPNAQLSAQVEHLVETYFGDEEERVM